MQKLSVYIITFNEEARISKVLDSLSGLDVCSEIIIVDSGSCDKTQEISKNYNKVIFVYNPWQGYGLQKRYAESLCNNDWVLNLDADEVLSKNLANEINDFMKNDCNNYIGAKAAIVNTMRWESEPNRFAYGISPVRLYRLSCGRYSSNPVFDRVEFNIQGQIKSFKGKISHYSYRDMTQHINKINDYTMMQALEAFGRGKKYSYFRLVSEFPLGFIKFYLLRGFIFQGFGGFLISMNNAFARYLRVAKVIELQKLAKCEDENNSK